MSIHEEIRDQQKKTKDMTFKEKLSYFWDYYKVHTIVTLAVIIVGGVFIHDAVTAKDHAFSAILLNSYGSDSQDILETEFAGYANIDLNTYDCYIDTASILSYASMDQMDLAVSQKIIAMSQTDGLDVLISDITPFSNFAEGMMFFDLREELTAEEYKKYEPDFFYIDAATLDSDDELVYDESGMPVVTDDSIDHSDPSAMADPMPVGIYLKDSAKLAQYQCYTTDETPPVLGFVVTSAKKENAHLFLQYLMEE
ncbi:hypothetical protein EDD76_10267 [Kineothrix alysoides]|uniref:Uncharacterized protein n=1 Tax=Kineothrix alysoides TaxID=1469948 RepID=A0A4R1R523_9FIRM|nr:hypothetical protein [Kineothrix alysoides]TCL60372.1 hypothetical protein EDD76_10267 [Kineothrix alysoides]